MSHKDGRVILSAWVDPVLRDYARVAARSSGVEFSKWVGRAVQRAVAEESAARAMREDHARGQQVTPWDLGWWRCPACDLRLTPEAAATLIDAVLRVSSPDSDSYDKNEHVFADALAAFKANDDA